jgi:D-ribose pyranase
MLKTGILNPHVNSLLNRIRHTNMLVISDRGFPFWPMIETVDITLVDGIPTVLQVLNAITPYYDFDQAYMANEFLAVNSENVRQDFATAFGKIPVQHEPHIEFKKRVPHAIGLIRTADTVPYANMILVSG